MGVLRVRAGGVWVDVGGGSDPIWVDPTAPTDPNYELWYDTDATAYSPDTGPRGVIGRAVKTDAQNGITTTPADVAGLSVSFTAVAGRLYRAMASLFVLPPSGGGGISYLTDVSNNTLCRWDAYTAASGAHAGVTLLAVVAPAAGPYTIKVRAQSATGVMNVNGVNSPAVLIVEDVGVAV